MARADQLRPPSREWLATNGLEIADICQVQLSPGRYHSQSQVINGYELAKGSYTIVLTTLDGLPVATLVNAAGEFVITFDNVLFIAGN